MASRSHDPYQRGSRVRDKDGDIWRKGTTMWSWEGRSAQTGPGKLPWYRLVDQYGPLTVVSRPEGEQITLRNPEQTPIPADHDGASPERFVYRWFAYGDSEGSVRVFTVSHGGPGWGYEIHYQGPRPQDDARVADGYHSLAELRKDAARAVEEWLDRREAERTLSG